MRSQVDPVQLVAGELNAAIAREAVRAHRELAGRGPTKAQAFFRGDVVVVVLRDPFTKGERLLLDRGMSEAALDVREELHNAMRQRLVDIVERLTQRGVQAFMAGAHAGPEVAVQLFVLDGPVRVALARDAELARQ
jgi:uncharacterized protein YbcI